MVDDALIRRMLISLSEKLCLNLSERGVKMSYAVKTIVRVARGITTLFVVFMESNLYKALWEYEKNARNHERSWQNQPGSFMICNM